MLLPLLLLPPLHVQHAASEMQRLSALLEWVQSHGGWLNPSLELRDGQFGAGVFAVQPVRNGEALVKTPQGLTISGDSVLAHCRRIERDDEAAPVVAAVARLLAKNQTSEAISLFIAQQRSHSRLLEVTAGAADTATSPSTPSTSTATRKSWFHPFISAMPGAVANALAFSSAEIGALHGSQAESAAREMQQSAARQFAHLCLTEPALFGSNCDETQSDQEWVLAEDMLWATSMV